MPKETQEPSRRGKEMKNTERENKCSAHKAARRGGVIAGDADQSVEAKIRNVRLEFVVEENIRWLDVSVDKFSRAAFVKQEQSTQEGATENDQGSQIYSKGDFHQLFGAKTRKIVKITLLG
ncbi:hypothetical protein D5086_019439 [Populus alba]|uniref:Uncharacterized protein n=1 Tax=Populus alba TaxID=43335 RepID=A0ACC4BHB5_POPAL